MVNNETEAKSKVVRWLPDDDEDGFVILDRNKFEKVSSISILHRCIFRGIDCVGVAFLSRLCWLFLCDHIVSRKSYLSTSKHQSSSRASSESCTGASSIRQVAVCCVDAAMPLIGIDRIAFFSCIVAYQYHIRWNFRQIDSGSRNGRYKFVHDVSRWFSLYYKQHHLDDHWTSLSLAMIFFHTRRHSKGIDRLPVVLAMMRKFLPLLHLSQMISAWPLHRRLSTKLLLVHFKYCQIPTMCNATRNGLGPKMRKEALQMLLACQTIHHREEMAPKPL